MTGLLFASVVLITASIWVMRRVRAGQARARTRRGPGTSLEEAIPVASFEDIDREIAARRCHCGARVRATGEGARAAGAQRFRYARLECDECEDEHLLFFDVTNVLH